MSDTGKDTETHRRIDLPVYPKAFVANAQLKREPNQVFVAMPFKGAHTDYLWEIIISVCKIHGFEARRGDTTVYPNPVVADILEELERAEIIIADLTDLNPNVLYELGIAHVRCDAVLLLCQKGQALPFNLAALRCLFFGNLEPLSDERGLFAKILGDTLNILRQKDKPTVLTSPVERTKLIVEDLRTLGDMPDEDLRSQIVCFSGYLSSFAIGSDEPFQPDEDQYHQLLIEERDELRRLASRGCRIKCIVGPPNSEYWKPYNLGNTKRRLKYLIKFLNSDDPALASIEWAISSIQQKNQFIIGTISCSEGYKKGHETGFGLTCRKTSRSAILYEAKLYEILFEEFMEQTLLEYGEVGAGGHIKALRYATMRALSNSLEYCNSLKL